MKTILITGIGGLTPRSIAKIIRKNHPNYKLIGCDIEKKAVGFFMKGLLDETPAPLVLLIKKDGSGNLTFEQTEHTEKYLKSVS